MSAGPAKVVLASTSSSRAAILNAAGVVFEVRAPGVDEDAVKAGLLSEGLGPREIADALAELKAVRISGRTEGLVIGADQTLELDGAMFDKAGSLDEARARLRMLRGRQHKLHSAVVVALNGAPIWREAPTATLSMRAISDDFLEDYLAREGEGLLGSVGCYRLEGLGVQLFSRIEGDYFAILGLPLFGLLDLLRRHGAVET